jgi:hypothetical protein
VRVNIITQRNAAKDRATKQRSAKDNPKRQNVIPFGLEKLPKRYRLERVLGDFRFNVSHKRPPPQQD